jgi:hypothetical protein
VRARSVEQSDARWLFFSFFFFNFSSLEDFLATNSKFKARLGLSFLFCSATSAQSSTKRPPNTSLQTLGKQNILQKIFLVLAQTHTKTRTSHSTPSRVIECIYTHTHTQKHTQKHTFIHASEQTRLSREPRNKKVVSQEKKKSSKEEK